MMPTKIEWVKNKDGSAGETWSPITGCTKISEGCRHCFAESMAKRFWKDRKFSDIRFHPERLDQPLKWKKPRTIFVCSMSDLFHSSIKTTELNLIFNIISRSLELALGHKFLILTKRPKRMKKYIEEHRHYETLVCYQETSNVWLGTTVENDKHYDRIETLLQIPAAVHFVSIEPMLSEINISKHLGRSQISWVICGGESGPKARPMHPDWVRSVRDQCVNAGVPFFFKQWGEWCPDDFDTVGVDGKVPRRCWVHSVTGETFDYAYPNNACGMMKVGKKAAGGSLDGKTWGQYPR
jgi:protein gp37